MKKLIIISVVVVALILVWLVSGFVPRIPVAQAVSDISPTVNQQQIDTGINVKAIPVVLASDDFRISIPEINLDMPVQADVDPADPAVYLPVIQQEVAHGLYTMLPDQATHDGNVYLFAHRDGSSGFFHRLNELGNGDLIKLRYQGKIYSYSVYQSFIINSSDVWVYTADAQKPTLTLQTCENGTLQRLIVKAELVSVTD